MRSLTFIPLAALRVPPILFYRCLSFLLYHYRLIILSFSIFIPPFCSKFSFLRLRILSLSLSLSLFVCVCLYILLQQKRRRLDDTPWRCTLDEPGQRYTQCTTGNACLPCHWKATRRIARERTLLLHSVYFFFLSSFFFVYYVSLLLGFSVQSWAHMRGSYD